ncbi:pyridoxamine 5'-phosphate oxidase family protein [Kitasatospora sp. GP82]|uniref:pyridoxamine 5'-phosphate oxidase family protein n=1 Tax=Kitasatospora sp. GP82 TaxID=3035089 RepID=UPI00247577DF|nr:pyridoxamine 5'-phosphate oxidase family protein [Kitasatospora sp. GP82]
MDRDKRVETLSEAECLHLLSTVPIGRVVYTEHALPAVLPVAFEVTTDGRLMLALRAGHTVPRALDGTVAAFQGDQLDAVTRTGWSVLVHGRAEVVRDPVLREHLLHTGPRPWVTGQEQLFVTITPELLSGRRLLPAGRAVQTS